LNVLDILSYLEYPVAEPGIRESNMRVRVMFSWKSESQVTASRVAEIEVDDLKEAKRWANLAIATGLMNKNGPITYTIDQVAGSAEPEKLDNDDND